MLDRKLERRIRFNRKKSSSKYVQNKKPKHNNNDYFDYEEYLKQPTIKVVGE